MSNKEIRFLYSDNIADFLLEKGWKDDKTLDNYLSNFYSDKQLKIMHGEIVFYTTDMIEKLKDDYPDIADIFNKLSYKNFQLYLDYHFDGHDDFEIGKIEIEHHDVGDIFKEEFNSSNKLFEKFWNSENIEKEIETYEKQIAIKLATNKLLETIKEFKSYCLDNHIETDFNIIKNNLA